MQRLFSLSASKTAVQTPITDVQQVFCLSLFYGWHLDRHGHYFSDLTEAVGECTVAGPTTVLLTRFLRNAQLLIKMSKALQRKAAEAYHTAHDPIAADAQAAAKALQTEGIAAHHHEEGEGEEEEEDGAESRLSPHQLDRAATLSAQDVQVLRDVIAAANEHSHPDPTPQCHPCLEALLQQEGEGANQAKGVTIAGYDATVIGYKLWLIVTGAEFTQSELWKCWQKSGRFDSQPGPFSKQHWLDEVAPLSSRIANMAGAWHQTFDAKDAADGHFGQSHFLMCQGTPQTAADSNHPLHLFSPYIDLAFAVAFAPEKCGAEVCYDQTLAYRPDEAMVHFGRRAFVMALSFDELSPAKFLSHMLPREQLIWFFYVARLSAITDADDDGTNVVIDKQVVWEKVASHPLMQVDNVVTQQIRMTASRSDARKPQQRSWLLTLARFLDGVYETNGAFAGAWEDNLRATPYGALRFYARKIALFMSKHTNANNPAELRYVYEVTRVLLHNLFQLTCMNPNNPDLSSSMRSILRVLFEGGLLQSNKSTLPMDSSVTQLSLFERTCKRWLEERSVLNFDGRLVYLFSFLFYGTYQSLRMDSTKLNFNVLLLSKMGDTGKSRMWEELKKLRIPGTTEAILYESDRALSTPDEKVVQRIMINDEFDSTKVGVGPPGTSHGSSNRATRTLTASNWYGAIYLEIAENGKRTARKIGKAVFQATIGSSNVMEIYTKIKPADERRFQLVLINENVGTRSPSEMLRAEQMFGTKALPLQVEGYLNAQLQQGILAIIEALITSNVISDVGMSLITVFMPMLAIELSTLPTSSKLSPSMQERVTAYARSLCIIDVINLLFRVQGAPFAGKPITSQVLIQARPWLDRLLFIQRRHLFVALMYFAPQLLKNVELRVIIALWSLWKKRMDANRQMCDFHEKDMGLPQAEGRVVFRSGKDTLTLLTLIGNELKSSPDEYTIDNAVLLSIFDKWQKGEAGGFFLCTHTYGYDGVARAPYRYQAGKKWTTPAMRMHGGNIAFHIEWLEKVEFLTDPNDRMAPAYTIMEKGIKAVLQNAHLQRSDTFLSGPFMQPKLSDPPLSYFKINTDPDQPTHVLQTKTPGREPKSKSRRLGLSHKAAADRAKKYVLIPTELDVWACLHRCEELHISFDIDNTPAAHKDTSLYGASKPRSPVDETVNDAYFMGWKVSDLLHQLDELADSSLDHVIERLKNMHRDPPEGRWLYKEDPALVDPAYHTLSNGDFFGTSQAACFQTSRRMEYHEWITLDPCEQEVVLKESLARGLFVKLHDPLDQIEPSEEHTLEVHSAAVYRLVWPVGYYFEQLILAHASEQQTQE